jgi:hypothetical protein
LFMGIIILLSMMMTLMHMGFRSYNLKMCFCLPNNE